MPDREKVIREKLDEMVELTRGLNYVGFMTAVENANEILALLKEQEAKTGHWIFESRYCEAWSHKCSECGKLMTTAVNTFANWCWNCGAKMTDRR